MVCFFPVVALKQLGVKKHKNGLTRMGNQPLDSLGNGAPGEVFRRLVYSSVSSAVRTRARWAWLLSTVCSWRWGQRWQGGAAVLGGRGGRRRGGVGEGRRGVFCLVVLCTFYVALKGAQRNTAHFGVPFRPTQRCFVFASARGWGRHSGGSVRIRAPGQRELKVQSDEKTKQAQKGGNQI